MVIGRIILVKWINLIKQKPLHITSQKKNHVPIYIEQGSKDAHANNGQQPTVEEKIFTDEELVALIDPILQMDDTSKDGYIDYPEFMRAQQKSQQNQQQQQQQQQQTQKSGH